MQSTEKFVRDVAYAFLKYILTICILSVSAAVPTHATAPSESDAMMLWRKHIRSQLLPAIRAANFKSFAVDRPQKLYIRFRIGENGKAQSISFTDRTDAEPAARVAIENIISSIDFQVPPPDAKVEWLNLPLTIEQRVPETAQPSPN